MSKEEILEELEELQSHIDDTMELFADYVENEDDEDTDLSFAYEELDIAVANLNEQLDNFSSTL